MNTLLQALKKWEQILKEYEDKSGDKLSEPFKQLCIRIVQK